MTEHTKEEIQEIVKKAKGLGKEKKTSSPHKSIIEIKENPKTGEMTASHKFYKKDGAVFSQLTPAQQDCEIMLWSRCNLEIWQQIVEAFIREHSKQEEYTAFEEIADGASENVH